MSPPLQEKNKALVLEAFDTLFNKRDYAAARRFWSPNYIQHSAHIGPGVTAIQLGRELAIDVQVRTGNDHCGQ